MADFAVFWEPGDVEVAIPAPTSYSFRRIPVGSAPDGTTIWSLYKEVTWAWPTLTEAELTTIKTAIQADGTIRFRTENDAGAMAVYVGKTDPYPSISKVRGRIIAPAFVFARVVEA